MHALRSLLGNEPKLVRVLCVLIEGRVQDPQVNSRIRNPLVRNWNQLVRIRNPLVRIRNLRLGIPNSFVESGIRW